MSCAFALKDLVPYTVKSFKDNLKSSINGYTGLGEDYCVIKENCLLLHLSFSILVNIKIVITYIYEIL